MTMLVLLAAYSQAAGGAITVDNFRPEETVRYPLVVLRGRAPGSSIAVNSARTSVANGEYRALVELHPGDNAVQLRSGGEEKTLRLRYQPPTTPLKVMAVWVRAKDEPELSYFLNPPGTKPMVSEKMDVALKVIQSFYAEAMNAAGYGRKTFPLELGRDGKVVVHVLSVPKTGAEMRAMENNASWSYLYGLLSKRYPEASTHWCAILGFSDYDPVSKKTPGHYALGGGSLGAFGSGSMPHWPASVGDVQRVLTDARLLNPAKDFDDSNRRRTVWANVATAWGAMAHEMGHTFGLPHSNDPFSVMSRGFDFFNRTFVAKEAPSARNPLWHAFRLDEQSRWDRYSAAKLNWNPYFQADAAPRSTTAEPSIRIEGETVVISAPAGIRVWGADRDDADPYFSEFLTNPPKEVRVPMEELRRRFRPPFRITVVDSDGRQTVFDAR